MRNKFPKKTFRVFHLLQQAHSALFRATDKRLRRTEGVTTAQNGVLLVLSIQDGVPITTIADQLRMGKSSLTGLVDRMSDRGLLRREVSPEDGRVQLVYLEPSGREILDRTRKEVKTLNDRLLEPFSVPERQIIERFLTHISHHAEEMVDPDPGIAGQSRKPSERT